MEKASVPFPPPKQILAMSQRLLTSSMTAFSKVNVVTEWSGGITAFAEIKKQLVNDAENWKNRRKLKHKTAERSVYAPRAVPVAPGIAQLGYYWAIVRRLLFPSGALSPPEWQRASAGPTASGNTKANVQPMSSAAGRRSRKLKRVTFAPSGPESKSARLYGAADYTRRRRW